jgi:hypothetical protein
VQPGLGIHQLGYSYLFNVLDDASVSPQFDIFALLAKMKCDTLMFSFVDSVRQHTVAPGVQRATIFVLFYLVPPRSINLLKRLFLSSE